MFPNLRRHFVSDRARRAYTQIEKAIRKKAELISEREFHLEMAHFYTSRVSSIDPHKEWWDFADSKQKEFDNQRAASVLNRQVEEAEAKVAAYRIRYQEARVKLDE